MSVIEESPPAEAPAVAAPLREPQPAHGTLEMIDAPRRGDREARVYLWIGIGFYLVFSLLFVSSLLGAQADRGAALLELFGISHAGVNWIVLVLIASGIGLTLFAMWTVVADLRRLAGEEDDVEWLLRRKREGRMLVFAPAGEREARFAKGERTLRPGETPRVETLVDDRVRRVHQARIEGGSPVSAEELRGIAETRTARYGHVARFASSLLLLLAVLGTFAGVKTALPSLIDAVGAAGGSGVESIVGPLRAVADAFGGNALALVGAIAAGLMAQGLAVGRRSLLERLELASAEYVYDGRRTQSADPLIAAVETLAATAGEVHNASTAFLGIEGSLELLGDSFRTAFASLDDRLSEVMRQQDEMLHQRTSQAMEELQSRVSDLAGVVAGNTAAYQGLVDKVAQRASESQQAVDAMRAAAAGLDRGLQGILLMGTASETASSRLEEGIRVLVEGTQRVDERMAAVAEAVERTRPALREIEVSVAGAAERVAGIDARAAASWREVGEQVRGQLAELGRVHASAPMASGAAAGLPPDAVALLRRIAAAAEAGTGPTPQQLALGVGAGVLGAAVVAWVATSLGGWIYTLTAWIGG